MPEDRKMEIIDMEVKHVELGGARAYLVQHQHVIGDDIADCSIEPQRLRAARHEIGRRDGIAACEQRHFMALGDEVLGEIGDDAFRSPIEPRRDAFHQGRDLGDLHCEPSVGEKWGRHVASHVRKVTINAAGAPREGATQR
jgi:hypothetical protein